MGVGAAEVALVDSQDLLHVVVLVVLGVAAGAEQLDVALSNLLGEDDKQNGVGHSLTRISNALDKHDNTKTQQHKHDNKYDNIHKHHEQQQVQVKYVKLTSSTITAAHAIVFLLF